MPEIPVDAHNSRPLRLRRTHRDRCAQKRCIPVKPVIQAERCPRIAMSGSCGVAWNTLLTIRRYHCTSAFRCSYKVTTAASQGVGWYSYRNAYELELLVSNASLLHIDEVVFDLTTLDLSIQPLNWTKAFQGMTKAIAQRPCEKLTIVGGLFPSRERHSDNDGDIKRSCPRWFRSDMV
jgi:hypothetical protein